VTLHIDFETRSDVDIKTAGAYRYFESPHADALFASYRIGDGPLQRWIAPDPCPDDIRAHVEAGGTITAHNAAFERVLWQTILTPRHGWPAVEIEQFQCSAATAAALALPRSLGDLGEALALDVQKDKDGWRLINKFSVPKRSRGDALQTEVLWNTAETHPDDWEKYRLYCDRDVDTEIAATRRMVPLSRDEQELYHIDQRINDRGIRIDVASAKAALALAEKAKARLDRRITIVTGGYVTACSQVARLTEWVQAQGVPMTSAAKAEIEELLAFEDLPAHVREAVELRQEAAKTSVAKLKSFLKRAGRDGRIRGAFLYHAASTGRWSSVGAQLHNLPRPRKEYGDAKLNTAQLFQAIRTGEPDVLTEMYGDHLGRPLHLLADAIRGFIWAAPGHDLLVADYSGIEGVVAAWFAGEQWKVDAIREIAADSSAPDLYMRAAAGIFGVEASAIGKKDERRQVGKVSELSLQYQGGPGAFRSMARNYAMDLSPLYSIVWPAAPELRREKALHRYENAAGRKEPVTELLSREQFLAVECIKLGWRASHPAIVETWSLLEDAMAEAVENPGVKATVHSCQYLVARGFLWCRLPSGRVLAYGSPRMKEQVWAKRRVDGEWLEESVVLGRDEAEALERKGEAKIERSARSSVTAMTVDSVTKKWKRGALYGGLAFENIVQAIARDLLANGIRKAEGAGYPVIGHVHDEILTEVPRDFGDVEEFEKLICELPAWADGLPLAASGWRGKRYRKD
jgi:DNA polymerase